MNNPYHSFMLIYTQLPRSLLRTIQFDIICHTISNVTHVMSLVTSFSDGSVNFYQLQFCVRLCSVMLFVYIYTPTNYSRYI